MTALAVDLGSLPMPARPRHHPPQGTFHHTTEPEDHQTLHPPHPLDQGLVQLGHHRTSSRRLPLEQGDLQLRVGLEGQLHHLNSSQRQPQEPGKVRQMAPADHQVRKPQSPQRQEDRFPLTGPADRQTINLRQLDKTQLEFQRTQLEFQRTQLQPPPTLLGAQSTRRRPPWARLYLRTPPSPACRVRTVTELNTWAHQRPQAVNPA